LLERPKHRAEPLALVCESRAAPALRASRLAVELERPPAAPGANKPRAPAAQVARRPDYAHRPRMERL
jgi:hypothetical protein